MTWLFFSSSFIFNHDIWYIHWSNRKR
jgi:hypothetical protein